jgi:hypothetical protein
MFRLQSEHGSAAQHTSTHANGTIQAVVIDIINMQSSVGERRNNKLKDRNKDKANGH